MKGSRGDQSGGEENKRKKTTTHNDVVEYCQYT